MRLRRRALDLGAMRRTSVAVGKASTRQASVFKLPTRPHPPLHSWYHEDRSGKRKASKTARGTHGKKHAAVVHRRERAGEHG